MNNKLTVVILSIIANVTMFVSCDSVLQGMAAGMGGYGMGGYEVMPGGYVRSTQYDYLLDPRLAYQKAMQSTPPMPTLPTVTVMPTTIPISVPTTPPASVPATTSSGSSSYSGSSISSSSSNSSRDCRRCMGSGKCQTCNGSGYYDKIGLGSGRFLCPNCDSNHNGKCAICHGTGKV